MARDEPSGAAADHRRPLPFSAIEYGETEWDFVWEAVSEVARRSHPLLAQIPDAKTSSRIIT